MEVPVAKTYTMSIERSTFAAISSSLIHVRGNGVTVGR
jgi:hypothetical protein